jgi:hypothetical protein
MDQIQRGDIYGMPIVSLQWFDGVITRRTEVGDGDEESSEICLTPESNDMPSSYFTPEML